jgi:hypothetical protein
MNNFQVHIEVLRKEEMVMVHRRVKENGISQILRSITLHSLQGLNLSQHWAILASFVENIKVTHKGKQLQVKFNIKIQFDNFFHLRLISTS